MARRSTKQRDEKLAEYIERAYEAFSRRVGAAALIDYVSRGRKLRSLTTESLSAEFVTSAHAWASAPRDPGVLRRYTDAEAEFRLRGQEPPSALIADATAQGLERVVGEFGEMLPEDQERALHSLLGEYLNSMEHKQ
jgi:hypothetical protein